MKNILKKILLICSLFVFTNTLVANEQMDLQKHLLDKIDKITTIIQDDSLSKNKRNNEIIKTIKPSFDFEIMAKLSLGKKTWRKLNTSERKRFTNLYVKRMEKSYSSKLDAYNNEIVEVKKILQPKKNRIFLITDLIGSDKKLEIVYKFYKPKKPKKAKHSWLIYDVEILGVSILKTDNAQFKDFLKTKNISDLMNILDDNT